ncbi:M2 family metallopeptidase [Paludifilum halophilum]|nr:M2 family metallopeptidase [Paludifilum halophilum]
MEEKAKAFLDDIVPEIQSLNRKTAEAYWKASTTGEKRYEEEYARSVKELLAIYADAERFQTLKKLRDASLQDPLIRRQIDLLYAEFVGNQMKPEQIEERVRLETEIESIFVNFRAEYRGEKVSDNEIKEAFRRERNTYKRKDLWKASKQVGAQVKDRLLRLVRLRNETAEALGYRDFYQMSLSLNEIDESELFTLLEELKEQTDQPFSDMKKEMDKTVAGRYDFLRPEGIRPWHYEDPFFQEAPKVFEANMDDFFKEKKLEDLADRTYRGIGLDVAVILEQSDLYEREGKSQHAFCMDIDRAGDTRVLCNLRSDAYWMNTLLHELGHGVYDKYHDRDLPYLLRQPAHISATEAVAMLMGRLGKDPEWLRCIAGVPEERLKEVRESIRKQSILDMLVFVRWCLVMVYFERDLYTDPDRNLNQRWWDYVEQFQFLPRPEHRNQPDWASKIHLAVAPVYYQNYLLGELMASQILETMRRELKTSHPLVEREEAGPFLRDRLFKPGARLPWNEWLKQATGEKLNPRYFVEQFVDAEATTVEKK